MAKAFYRPDEVADRFAVSKRTIYRLISDEVLRVVRIRGCVRIPAEEVRRLESGTEAGDREPEA